MAKQIKIQNVKLANLTEEQARTHVQHGYFDDNGGETDGNLYLAEEGDLTRTDGVEFKSGYKVEAYSGPAGYSNYTGWSSRDTALTTDSETADAIAIDEYGVRESNA